MGYTDRCSPVYLVYFTLTLSRARKHTHAYTHVMHLHTEIYGMNVRLTPTYLFYIKKIKLWFQSYICQTILCVLLL